MPDFGSRSRAALVTTDRRLVAVMYSVIPWFDFSVLEGHRDEDAQNAAHDAGNSKKRWPDGKHNTLPSNAVDVAPYPIDWEDRERFVYLAGAIMGAARAMGIPLRWGGDWDMDTEVRDERFRDLGHFELTD